MYATKFAVPTKLVGSGLQRTIGNAHTQTAVTSYSYEVEKLDPISHKWVAYTWLDATWASDTSGGPYWTIAPRNPTLLTLAPNPLKTSPILNEPQWVGHSRTRFTFKQGDLKIRLGRLSVNGTPVAADTRTGCTAFRFEPASHASHAPSWNSDFPCKFVKLTTGDLPKTFNVLKGLKALDLSSNH